MNKAFAIAVCAAVAATYAHAQPYPKRNAGLWEATSSFSQHGMPGMASELGKLSPVERAQAPGPPSPGGRCASIIARNIYKKTDVIRCDPALQTARRRRVAAECPESGTSAAWPDFSRPVVQHAFRGEEAVTART